MKDLFKMHMIQQALFPDKDSHQWCAFLILREKYPKLTYLSYDGYSCDGLADYTKDIVWQRDKIIDWKSKEELLSLPQPFWEYSTNEICTIWMKVNGETTKTKQEWLWSFK